MPERIVPFTAGDGLACNLVNVRGESSPTRGPVILVHGAGVRANLFRPPVDQTFVQALTDHGYDVWLENWRASIDLPANRWTLDQAALYDHPAAVRKVVAETGAEEIKAVIHCQGSTSFMMSAVAGLVPQVKTIVSNAVSLHPMVPWHAEIKSMLMTPLTARVTDFLDPRWGLHAEGLVPNLVRGLVQLTHHECDNMVCKLSSFTYGSGHPTLWRHENLNPATHEWLKQEFGAVPLTFFEQMGVCMRKGRLVSVEDYAELPTDFTAQAPKTDARFAFIAGEQNACFVAESQERTFDFFQKRRPDYHSLQVLPDYGHLDIFIGKNASTDVFPILIEELDRKH